MSNEGPVSFSTSLAAIPKRGSHLSQVKCRTRLHGFRCVGCGL